MTVFIFIKSEIGFKQSGTQIFGINKCIHAILELIDDLFF